jgi:branched-chain amino acid transport system substrate-binding protein
VLFNSISQSDAIVAAPNWSPYTSHEALTPYATTQAVGRYVFSRYNKRVALLAAHHTYGYETVRGFEEAGKQFGIEVVENVRHPLGTTDFGRSSRTFNNAFRATNGGRYCPTMALSASPAS